MKDCWAIFTMIAVFSFMIGYQVCTKLKLEHTYKIGLDRYKFQAMKVKVPDTLHICADFTGQGVPIACYIERD